MSVKLLLYCTKAKPNITRGNNGKVYPSCMQNQRVKNHHLNGKIVAECTCDKVEEIFLQGGEENLTFGTKSLFSIERKSCLDFEQLESYFGYNNDIWGYALHLSNVKVFDEPKELSEYLICNDDKTYPENWKQNQYAPQNMKNVYESCSIFSYFSSKILLKKYVLISIQPQHLCKILNGEKTIEVRKKILNSLKEVKENEN